MYGAGRRLLLTADIASVDMIQLIVPLLQDQLVKVLLVLQMTPQKAQKMGKWRCPACERRGGH